MPEEKRSAKHTEARNALARRLVPLFDELVQDYKFSSIKHYGKPFVSYHILADLVTLGWRPPAQVKGSLKKSK